LPHSGQDPKRVLLSQIDRITELKRKNVPPYRVEFEEIGMHPLKHEKDGDGEEEESGRVCQITSTFISVDDLKQLDRILSEDGEVAYTVEFGNRFYNRKGVERLLDTITDTSRVETLTVSMESSHKRITIKLNESADQPNGMKIEGLNDNWVNGRFDRLTSYFKARKTLVHIVHYQLFRFALGAAVIAAAMLVYFQLNNVYRQISYFESPWWLPWVPMLPIGGVLVAFAVAAMIPRWLPFANLQIGGLKKERLISRKAAVQGIVSSLVVYTVAALAGFVWKWLFP